MSKRERPKRREQEADLSQAATDLADMSKSRRSVTTSRRAPKLTRAEAKAALELARPIRTGERR